jgi:aminopeptidase-like protein
MEYVILINRSQQLENEINRYLQRLFPINRSITGDGNRETLRILKEVAPSEIKEYSSGEKVYEWTRPDEWNVKDAWIKDADGNKLIDFKLNNVHLVGYSEPIHKKISFIELKDHLFTHDDLPDAIPYRTTYYKRDWGFCATQAQYNSLSTAKNPLEVCIDSKFNPAGSLSIGELLIPGESKQEILISTYICHPSLANDNLSGAVMTAFLARELLRLSKPKYSYRIIWVPETIGAITYCSMNEKEMKAINIGLMITTVGGSGEFGYKQSFDQSHNINSVIEGVFKQEGLDYITYPFDIHGSDERQYSSQGFRINMVSITKDKYYEYPYYHTSLDNLDYVKAKYILQTLQVYLKVFDKLTVDFNKSKVQLLGIKSKTDIYKNKYPNCEIMLSKHGLYPQTGGAQLPELGGKSELDLILWLLWFSDGSNSLYDIAHKLDCQVEILKRIARNLTDKGLLQVVS